VPSHCCFNLHFPDNTQHGASFHVLICNLYIIFSEVSVKVFCPFLKLDCFLIIEFLKILKYILGNYPLSDISAVNILSQSEDCLFILYSDLQNTKFYF
jgi:hypothetical protein